MRGYYIRRLAQKFDLILIMIIPALFVVGTYGFHVYFLSSGDEEFADLTWIDSAYNMLCAFVLEFDAPSGPKPWQLEVARWLAPLSIFAVFANLLKNVFRREWPRFQARLTSGHTVVCGLGARGRWIVRDLLVANKKKSKIIGLDVDAGSDALAELKEEGAVTLAGNGADITLMRELNIGKASRLVIAAGDDEINLSIAREVADQKKAPAEIIAAVEQYEGRSYFTDLLAKQNIKIIGFRYFAGLRLANEIAVRLSAVHGPIPKRPPVLCVEASDALRIELLRALVMLVQISGDEPPVIHVCGADTMDRAYLDDLFPAANLAASFHWHEETAIKRLRQVAKDFDQVDAAIFALEPDTASLHAAKCFEMACVRNQALVYACILDTDNLYKLAKSREKQGDAGMAMTSGVIVKSLYEIKETSRQGALFDLHEEGARSIAAKYDEKYDDVGESFENKSAFIQNSNRMAAMHADVKRALWSKRTPDLDDEQVIEHLCKCEHMRWMGFHVMEGWQPCDGKKDPQRKLHPDLKPFVSLDAEGKTKDRDPVDWAIKGEC